MKHVLIVDDDDAVRHLLAAFLKERGYRANTAESGESAIAWLSHHHPDMMLLDIRIPGISGIEVLEHTRRTHPDLPVIVISGYADEDLAREALEMGAYDFFLRPFDLGTVETRLSTKLDLQDPAAEAGGR